MQIITKKEEERSGGEGGYLKRINVFRKRQVLTHIELSSFVKEA